MLDEYKLTALHRGEALPLMEAFYSLQGEGYYKGSAAYFIRLGGCDVGCHWCDVKDSSRGAKAFSPYHYHRGRTPDVEP